MIRDRPKRLELLYINNPLYFITFSTRDRQKIPSLSLAQIALENFGRYGVEKFGFSLSQYMIMPDHIHLLVRGEFDFSPSQWVAGLKRAISKEISVGRGFWQPGFFDRVIRSHEDPEKKWLYVNQNPVRAGLVMRSEDELYQRRIVEDPVSAADTAAPTEGIGKPFNSSRHACLRRPQSI